MDKKARITEQSQAAGDTGKERKRHRSNMAATSLAAVAEGVPLAEAVKAANHCGCKAGDAESQAKLTDALSTKDEQQQRPLPKLTSQLSQPTVLAPEPAPAPEPDSSDDSPTNHSDYAYHLNEDCLTQAQSKVAVSSEQAQQGTAAQHGCKDADQLAASKQTQTPATAAAAAEATATDADADADTDTVANGTEGEPLKPIGHTPDDKPDQQNDPRYLEQRKHGSRIFPIDCHHWKTENGPCFGCWHWHPEVEIIHMVAGKGFEIEFLDRRFTMDAPAIFVVPCSVLHRINFDRSFTEYGVLGRANHTLFDPSILEMARFDEALNNTLGALESGMLSLSTPILESNIGFAELDKVLNFIDDHAKQKDAGMRLQIKGHLLQVLGLLHSFGYINNYHIERSQRNRQHQNEERIKELFAYIRSNYNRPLSIIDVASRLNVSKQYFCSLFKSLTNMSFVEYLNLVRLNCAAQDILQSGDPINEIAERHGFDSISYFFKVFKQQFNCTPNTFRCNKGVVKESGAQQTDGTAAPAQDKAPDTEHT